MGQAADVLIIMVSFGILLSFTSFLVWQASSKPQPHELPKDATSSPVDGFWSRFSGGQGIGPDLPNALRLSKFGKKQSIQGETEVHWQIPRRVSKAMAAGGPVECRGIIWLFHGCGHSASDFWLSGADCKECLGLPEEVKLASEFLSRNYIIAAISSLDRDRKCWSAEDIVRVQTAISGLLNDDEIVKQIQSKQPHAPLPVFGFGASSGGYFLEGISAYFAALCVQIAGFSADGSDCSPTLFNHMERDTVTFHSVERSLEKYKKYGIPAQQLGMKPLPIGPSFFHNRIGLTEEASKNLFNTFKQHGFLTTDAPLDSMAAEKGANSIDSQLYFLLEDPRKSHWRDVIQLWGPQESKTESLEPDKSAISELLNVAYGKHELFSENASGIANWFDVFGCIWVDVPIHAKTKSQNPSSMVMLQKEYISELRQQSDKIRSGICSRMVHTMNLWKQ